MLEQKTSNVRPFHRLENTLWIGKDIRYYEVTDSTNNQAKQLGKTGAEHGTLVIAEQQLAGRGRSGRSWESPKDGGIFMTLLLRPEIKAIEAPMLTLVTALSVAKAMRNELALPVEIKWPNDIVLNGKKLCGILTEMEADEHGIHYVVIGIGINLWNQSFSEEIASMATSVVLESGKNISKETLIEAVWREFETDYAGFLKSRDLSGMKEEYQTYLVNLDKQVKVLDPKEPYVGIARGITDTGELIVETQNGEQEVSSGEVSVRGIYGYV